jgi:uncharacterized FlaG/YvyC family protein
MIDRNKEFIQNNSKGTILNFVNSRQYNEQRKNLIQSNNKIEKLSERELRLNAFRARILAALNANIDSSSESGIVSVKEILLLIGENGSLT